MTGCLLKRERKDGGVSWLLKFDSGKDGASGKRRQNYITFRGSERQARKRLRELLHAVEIDGHVARCKMTVAEWVDEWLRHTEPTVAATTFQRYQELLRLHVCRALGARQLQKLNGTEIEELYTHLRSVTPRPLSERTILHLHRCLKACLAAAVSRKLLVRNPIDSVTPPRPGAATAACTERIRALDCEKLNTLVNGFRGNALYPIVLLAIGTGMRRGELLGLRWSDFDEERSTIFVTRSVEETNGFGLRFKEPKSKSSIRTVALDHRLCQLLVSMRAQSAGTGLVLPASKDQHDTPMRPRDVSRCFRAHARKLAFAGLRLHDLRHAHCSHLISMGVPIPEVARRVGHSTSAVTMAIYAHAISTDQDRSVRASEKLLSIVAELSGP